MTAAGGGPIGISAGVTGMAGAIGAEGSTTDRVNPRISRNLRHVGVPTSEKGHLVLLLASWKSNRSPNGGLKW